MRNRAHIEFQRLWEQTCDRIRAYMFCASSNADDTDDLAQECYLRALRNWHLFGRTKPFPDRVNADASDVLSSGSVPAGGSGNRAPGRSRPRAECSIRKTGAWRKRGHRVLYLRACGLGLAPARGLKKRISAKGR